MRFSAALGPFAGIRIRLGKVDDEPKKPERRLVYVLSQLGSQDRDAVESVHALQ